MLNVLLLLHNFQIVLLNKSRTAESITYRAGSVQSFCLLKGGFPLSYLMSYSLENTGPKSQILEYLLWCYRLVINAFFPSITDDVIISGT